MTVKQKLRSKILSVLLSPTSLRLKRWTHEQLRRISGRQHVVSVFLQLDDPYSYILSQYLQALASHYDIELQVYLSRALGDAYQPAPDMIAQNAIADCTRLAAELGIPFLDKGAFPPTEFRVGMSDALAGQVEHATFTAAFCKALEVYWRGDAAAAAEIGVTDNADAGSALTLVSQQRLEQMGHYNSAMLHYAGEWYWGVDRLSHLTDRLDGLGVARNNSADASLASLYQAKRLTLPIKPPSVAKNLPPIELFFSFRSPYSYLVLHRLFDIADAFGVEVLLRPVLPMVMRGMQVPHPKLKYIAGDAVREAGRVGVPFGAIADPLGIGVDRCMAVFEYAESEHKGREFIIEAGKAIWSEGIDIATDKGMRQVTGRCALFWPDVASAMQRDGWRGSVERNRESMMSSGCWGVPTIRMADFVSWGQDRDWLLIRHIEELCDTGDGILV